MHGVNGKLLDERLLDRLITTVLSEGNYTGVLQSSVVCSDSVLQHLYCFSSTSDFMQMMYGY